MLGIRWGSRGTPGVSDTVTPPLSGFDPDPGRRRRSRRRRQQRHLQRLGMVSNPLANRIPRTIAWYPWYRPLSYRTPSVVSCLELSPTVT